MADYKFLEQAIQKVMAYYSIPGCALAIIDKGETNYLQFGYSNIEEKMPFTVDTISGIGSCTKSMTAFLALIERAGRQGWCWTQKLQRGALCRSKLNLARPVRL